MKNGHITQISKTGDAGIYVFGSERGLMKAKIQLKYNIGYQKTIKEESKIACLAYHKDKTILISLVGDPAFYLVDHAKDSVSKIFANAFPESFPLKILPMSAILAKSRKESFGILAEPKLEASTIFLMQGSESLSLIDLTKKNMRKLKDVPNCRGGLIAKVQDG